MGIKEKIEGNIFIVLVTASVAVGGVVFGISKYFNEQRIADVERSLNLKLEQFESKLASIERDVPGIRHFDIRGLFLAEEKNQPIESNLIYFPTDKFYATDDDSFWSYSKTTEVELINLITGMDVSSGLFRMLAEKSKKYPIHLWRAKESFTMVGQDEKLNLFPHIILQRLPYTGVDELLGIGASFARWTEEKEDSDFDAEDLETTDDVEDFLSIANDAFYQDAAGMFFLIQNLANFQSSMISKNERFKIKKLQKIGNVLYSQFLTEYLDVDVDNANSNVYLHQELIIVAAQRDIYMIKISLPSREPSARVPVYANVNNWITSLKLVMN